MGKKSTLFVATLAVISFLYALDRVMLAVLAEPIKRELVISDSAFGVIIGILFSTVVTLFSVPLARLADRTSRATVLAGCLLFWSSATALCGMAANTLQLGMARVGVAVGESAAISIIHALIGAKLPSQRRGFALSMVGAGIYLGATSSYIVGGWLSEQLGWRETMMLVAVPGLLLGFGVRSLLNTRSPDEPKQPRVKQASDLRGTVSTLFRTRTYILVTCALVLCGGTSVAIGAWKTAMAMRSFDMSISEAGLWLGLATGVTGIAGQLFAGYMCGRWSSEKIVLLPAIAFPVGGLLTAFAFTATDAHTMVLLLIVPSFLFSTWYPALFATLQNVVPDDSRALATSIAQVFIHILGNGMGPTTVGWASDALAPMYGGESLRIALIGAAFISVPAGLVMLALDRTLRRASGVVPEALASR